MAQNHNPNNQNENQFFPVMMESPVQVEVVIPGVAPKTPTTPIHDVDRMGQSEITSPLLRKTTCKINQVAHSAFLALISQAASKEREGEGKIKTPGVLVCPPASNGPVRGH